MFKVKARYQDLSILSLREVRIELNDWNKAKKLQKRNHST
jgi:hypothetical protein